MAMVLMPCRFGVGRRHRGEAGQGWATRGRAGSYEAKVSPAGDAEVESELRAGRSFSGQPVGASADYRARPSRGEWLAARAPLEQRLQAAQAGVVEAEATEAVEVVDVDLRTVWPTLHVDRQRAVLAAVFNRVEVSPSTSGRAGADGRGRRPNRP